MESFGSYTNSKLLENIGKSEWERRQRLVFLETREEYNNEAERNTYMGYILNNLGLGPGTTMKTAD